MSTTVISAFEEKYKHPDESILYGFDFGPLLEDDETISSGTVVEITTTDLTIGSATVQTTEYKGDEGQLIYASESIKARISGGNNGTDYTLKATAITSAGNTRVLPCKIKCRNK